MAACSSHVPPHLLQRGPVPAKHFILSTNILRLPVVVVSCEKKQGLEQLGSALFDMLGVIRIYTKQPGAREPSQRPFTLQRGATLADLARSIHSDFERDFSFARVWAKRLVFSPQKVGLGFTLEDRDVVEFHMR